MAWPAHPQQKHSADVDHISHCQLKLAATRHVVLYLFGHNAQHCSTAIRQKSDRIGIESALDQTPGTLPPAAQQDSIPSEALDTQDTTQLYSAARKSALKHGKVSGLVLAREWLVLRQTNEPHQTFQSGGGRVDAM